MKLVQWGDAVAGELFKKVTTNRKMPKGRQSAHSTSELHTGSGNQRLDHKREKRYTNLERQCYRNRDKGEKDRGRVDLSQHV